MGPHELDLQGCSSRAHQQVRQQAEGKCSQHMFRSGRNWHRLQSRALSRRRRSGHKPQRQLQVSATAAGGASAGAAGSAVSLCCALKPSTNQSKHLPRPSNTFCCTAGGSLRSVACPSLPERLLEVPQAPHHPWHHPGVLCCHSQGCP